jgi:hypothetical protein
MAAGQAITVWLARASAVAYVIALLLRATSFSRAARMVWTGALCLYLLHVCGAFEYFYHWSHAIAYEETARQTAELFGVEWGGGIYLNYLFTIVWLVDCLWWWVRSESYGERPRIVARTVDGFLAFMFVNATIVVWLLRAYRR